MTISPRPGHQGREPRRLAELVPDAPLRPTSRVRIRAQRIRTLLMREMAKLMSEADVFLSPTNSSSTGLTNLTGHPAVAVRRVRRQRAVDADGDWPPLRGGDAAASRSRTNARRRGTIETQC